MSKTCNVCGDEIEESKKSEKSLVHHQGMIKCKICRDEYEAGLLEIGAKKDMKKEQTVRPGTQDWKEEITV